MNFNRKSAYYTAMVILLPFSIAFFATSIIGILVEELGMQIQKPGIKYKKELIRIAKELQTK